MLKFLKFATMPYSLIFYYLHSYNMIGNLLVQYCCVYCCDVRIYYLPVVAFVTFCLPMCSAGKP